MKPILTLSQGKLLRALVLFLSTAGKHPVAAEAIIVEAVDSRDWASLTFVGERHRIAVRLPVGTVPDSADAIALDVPGKIIAVEHADWTATDSGPRLTLEVLAIATREPPV